MGIEEVLRFHCAVLRLTASAQRLTPWAVSKPEIISSSPTLVKPGKPNVSVKAAGGTTAEIDLDHNCCAPVLVCTSAYQIAVVSIPRLKFIVSVPSAKLALRPRPHAGARAILLRLNSASHSSPSGPAVIP